MLGSNTKPRERSAKELEIRDIERAGPGERASCRCPVAARLVAAAPD
jgi:hypothetical protein